MTYTILDHVSNKLLLSAYLNPQNTYYIDISDCIEEEVEKCKGNKYALDNIIFGTPETQTDAVLCDEQSLSADDVIKLNEFLEIDKLAYLGNLYCDELRQLLEYEPFLGNKGCNIPITDTDNKDNKVSFCIKFGNVFLLDYIDALNNLGYERILTIGDYQKLVPESKVMVYNPTNNVDKDIENIRKILNNSYNIAFIPYISNSILTEDQHKLINAILDKVKFDEKIALTTYCNIYWETYAFNFDDYDHILLTNRMFRRNEKKLCNQYWIIDEGAKIIFLKDIKRIFGKDKLANWKNKFVHVNMVTKEFFDKDHVDYMITKAYRMEHPKLYLDPRNRFRTNANNEKERIEVLKNDYPNEYRRMMNVIEQNNSKQRIFG